MTTATIKYYRNTIAEFGHNDINEGESREAVADEWTETFKAWAVEEEDEDRDERIKARIDKMREEFIDGLEEVGAR